METIISILIIIGLVSIGIVVLFYRKKNRAIRNLVRIEKVWDEHVEDIIDGKKMQKLREVYGVYRKQEPRIDDITWNDLEMDGAFTVMNHTQTDMGEMSLYDMLRNPEMTEEKLLEREEFIRIFGDNEQVRNKLLLTMYAIGKQGNYSIYEFKNTLKDAVSYPLWVHVLIPLMQILSIILCFYRLETGVTLAFLVLVANIYTYYRDRAKVDRYMANFTQLNKVLQELTFIESKTGVKQLDEYFAHSEKVRQMQKKYRKYMQYVMMKGKGVVGEFEAVGDYVKVIMHMDLLFCPRIIKFIESNIDTIIEWCEKVGFIDSMLSVAVLRHRLQDSADENETYCIPELGGNRLIIEDGYCSLLEEPVPNTISVSRSMLITGSNATGKSTFLRMVAMNAILAQSIHTVYASKYQAPFYRVITLISIKDSIFTNDSYFMAEIKAVRRILEAADGEERILCCFDELLRGTNTVERIAAVSEILSDIAKRNASCIVATHDRELTNMLGENYENYHFQEEVRAEGMFFDFKIHQGVSHSRNAIELLRLMGYGTELVARARKKVDDYLINGTWQS